MNSCSLLIPCHNAANYLPRLWETVGAQIVPFDEIICYNDGSTDNTADVAREFGAKVIQSEKCRGVAFARNQLAKAATSTWIHFHDADDTLHPRYLEKSKSRINNDVDVIVCNADWIDEQTNELLIPRRYKQHELEGNPLESTITNPIGVISVLCRRDKFLSIGGFDESYQCWEDGDLHVRLAAAEAKFAIVEEVLSFSLRHSRGLSRDQLACSYCRFKLLKEYSQKFKSLSRECLIEQLELTAKNVLVLGDRKTAIEVIKFCQSLGGNPPTTKNLLLKIMKIFLPAVCLLQIQNFIRHSTFKVILKLIKIWIN